jgi:hypothetical protein
VRGTTKTRSILVVAVMVVLLAPNGPAQSGPHGTDNAADPPSWKTVSLGTFATADGLLATLEIAHITVGDLANEALHRPSFAMARSKFDLEVVILSAAQLGVGEKGGLRSDILARSQRLGLDLCPPEAAVQLRLQYLDQPLGEFLDVAMGPIATYSGQLVSFSLGNGGAGLILIGYTMTADEIVPQSRKFVFARPVRLAQPIVQ